MGAESGAFQTENSFVKAGKVLKDSQGGQRAWSKEGTH